MTSAFEEVINTRCSKRHKDIVKEYVLAYPGRWSDQSAFVRAAIEQFARHLRSEGSFLYRDLEVKE